MSKYEIKGELGRGGMGVVYRAVQIGLEREVALKVLPGNLTDADLLRRFRREVKIACGLSHPHIVPIYDGGELDGRPFYAMAIVRGEDLAAVIERGPTPFPEVVRWMQQGADALAYIHAQELAHRDLKPANLMLDDAKNLVVMDFGLAKDPAGTLLTEEGAVVGTPRYIAPEGFRGAAVGTPQDVYALALCAHELVLGENWEQSQSLMELAQRVLSGTPPTLAGHPDVPAWFVELQARALVADPGARLTAAQYRDGLKVRSRAPSARITRPQRALSRSGPIAVTDPGASSPVPGPGSLGATPRRITLPPWVSGLTESRRGLVPGLTAAVFVAGLAGAAYLVRGRDPAPSPAASARVEPAGALALSTPTFPAHRRVAFSARGTAPAGAEFVVKGSGSSWRAPVSDLRAPAAELSLPLARDLAVELVAGDRSLAGPLQFRTPGVEPIWRLHVQPTDVEALVDFDLERPVPLAVSLFRADGQRAGHSVQPAGPRHFSHWFEGLRPDTTYRLEVCVQDAWGGVSGFELRTESSKQTAAVQQARRLIRSSPEMVEYFVSIASRTPDRRLVPPLVDWLRSGHPSVKEQLKKVAWIAEKTRSRELAGELSNHLFDARDEQVQRYILGALALSRHPKAAAAARRLLGRWSTDDFLFTCVRALAVEPGPASVELLVPELRRAPLLTRAVEWLIRIDRESSRALFCEWLDSPDRGPQSMAHMAYMGMVLLRGDDEVRRLAAHLKPGPQHEFDRGMAAHALVAIATPQAREAIRAAYEASPEDQLLLWAVGRLGMTGQSTRVAAALARAAPPVRRDAACVLGLLGDRSSAPVLIAALTDPTPSVGEAAAWALGRLADPGAVRALAARATAPGAGDAALFALGAIGDPAGLPALDQVARDPGLASDRSRSFLVAWARGRLQGGTPPGASPEHPFFPLAPYDRTGVLFEPGDAMRIALSGSWRFGAGTDEAPARSLSVGDLRATGRGWLGGQVIEMDKTPRSIAVQWGGELLLSSWDPPPVHFDHLPREQPRGLGLVRIERAR